MIGTTAALITMAAVSAGTKAASAKMASNAANKASKAQQSAAADSNRVAGQVRDEAMQMTQPYRNAGAQSMGMLSSLMLPPGHPGAYQPGMTFAGAPPPAGPPMAQNRPMPARGMPPPNPWSVAGGGPVPPQAPRPPMSPPPGYSPWGAAMPGPNAFMPRY